MWNIGFGELAIICIVLIIAVGPERLPSMMKTVGKTVRTLRQASRDLRESTGIDELLREDFDFHPPPRRPAPVASIARDVDPVINPTTAELAPVAGQNSAEAVASLPSDGPLTAATSETTGVAGVTGATETTGAAETTNVAASAVAIPSSSQLATAAATDHANVTGTLPSDAPLVALAAKAPPITAPPPAGPLSVPPPPPAQDEAKPRES
ncbi:MAG TPA: twin-arginine translocase TatA/TatE family subunit [Polyangiales bacterium]|nr:twin-arginine translocase TatA/TatE family subunit [Polyangiales bacterium]